MFRIEGDREKGTKKKEKRKKKVNDKRVIFPIIFQLSFFLLSSSTQFSTEFRYQEKKC